MAAHEKAFLDQPVDGLAHRDARNLEIGGDLALGGKRVVGRQHVVLDGFPERALQLLVERLLAIRVERLEDFGKWAGHDIYDTCEIPICKHLTKWYHIGLQW